MPFYNILLLKLIHLLTLYKNFYIYTLYQVNKDDNILYIFFYIIFIRSIIIVMLPFLKYKSTI